MQQFFGGILHVSIGHGAGDTDDWSLCFSCRRDRDRRRPEDQVHHDDLDQHRIDRVDTGQQQASWRVDPKKAGGSGCGGDIGTHAHNLVRYITGLEIDEICSELTAFIPGRELDDDGNNLIRFKGGAKGIIYASQISNGDENALNIRAYGTKASIEWHQEERRDPLPDEFVGMGDLPRAFGQYELLP